MLTAYDYTTARIFDQAGMPVLLVGDSAANVVYGYDTTVPVTVDELLPLVRAVVRGASRALVVADLPFGSYQVSPQQALETAIRFLKEGGAQAVKLEGGARVAPAGRVAQRGGHPGDGPHRADPAVGEHAVAVTGCRAAATRRASGCSRTPGRCRTPARSPSCWRSCRPTWPRRSPTTCSIPTIGIGAGVECDAQVLVWQDMAGLRADGKPAKFVKQYADVAQVLTDATHAFAAEVQAGTYPGAEHSYH